MQKKTDYKKYLKINQFTFEVNKTFLCDMANANACQRRAQWYGYETIGPRIYALYRCPEHKMFKKRLN